MDAYIRQYKVWTPEQMLESFLGKIQEGVNRREFNARYENGLSIWYSEDADRWLVTKFGKDFAFERMKNKYKKDKPIAKANSPIVERVRFGLHWEDSKYFDISFGLKNGCNFVEIEELKKLSYKPWTVKHVEQQLKDLYSTKLTTVLNLLCTSPIEKKFYEYWIDNYYSKNAPAIIPEVCAFRDKFWYYEYKGCVYASHNDLPPVEDYTDVKSKNFRFDFFVSNTKKNKAILIELDGHEHHKTKSQRVLDSIKRNKAAMLEIPVSVVVFTGTQIHENIEACFDSIDDILRWSEN